MDAGIGLKSPQYKALSKVRHEKGDLRNTLVIASFITGGLALFGGIFAGVKKAKTGWVGALVGLIGVVIAVVTGTHMLS